MTYEQRMWVNDEYYDNTTGIVFLSICGEWTCQPLANATFAHQAAAAMKAKIVVLEHRFYGASQPFDNWDVKNLKWLNSTQALADIAHFIDAQNALWKETNPIKHRWVIEGGSYPGALSAWFKNMYPDHVVASWSSSGVIHPIMKFQEFDMQVYLSANKSGIECPHQVEVFITNIENAAMADDQSLFGTVKYNMNATKGMRSDEFFWYVSDIITMGVQYGARTSMCKFFSDIANLTFIEQTVNVSAYAKTKGVTANQYDYMSLRNTTYDESKNVRQWTYQFCTEFGWFQVPWDAHPMRSHYIAFDFWPQYCQRIFGDDLPRAATDWYNQKYGNTSISGNRTFFTNGGEDPWQWAGMRPPNQNKTGSLVQMKSRLIDCDDCGHCADVGVPKDSDPQILKDVREEVVTQLEAWLKEEEPKSVKKAAENQEKTIFMS